MFSIQFRKILASRLMRPLALLAIAAAAAPGTALANSPWATVGSTGIVDESCYMAIQMDNSEARLIPGLLFPCRVRYQVTDTYGTPAGTVANQALFANIRDTGAGNVVVRLLRYPNNGSAPAGIPVGTAINSDAGGTAIAANFKQFRSPAACVGAFNLDFMNNTYWIEVDMTGGVPPVLPGLAISWLQIRNC